MTIPTEQTDCVVCGSARHALEAEGRDEIYASSDKTFSAVRCQDCGHIYLRPRPSMQAIDVIYPAHYATFVGSFSRPGSLVAKFKDRVIRGRFARSVGELPRGARVLDVGCGDGQLLRSLRNARADLDLYGVDWHFAPDTRDALSQAKISLIEAPIEKAELPREHFDVIVMNQIIEHLWTPAQVLQRLREALKPGGRISIETPNTDGWDRKRFQAGRWGGYYFPRHLNLFSRAGLERFVADQGFRVEAHWDLVAPVIWVYSLAAWANQTERPRLGRWFGQVNPVSLGLFTLLDLTALLRRKPTSNQKLVAVRD